MNDNEMSVEAHRQLAEIQKRYRKEIQPLLDILAEIESRKPIPPIFIDLTAGECGAILERLKLSGVLDDEANE